MVITIIDRSVIKHNGYFLIPFQTYNDIDDKTCQELIDLKLAEVANSSIPGVSYTEAPLAEKTPQFNVEKNGGYVAEAVIDPAKKAKLEAEGKLNDKMPVVGEDKTLPKDNTPEPEIKTEVLDEKTGKALSEEELKARETQVAAMSGGNSEKVPTVGELQNAGVEIPKQ